MIDWRFTLVVSLDFNLDTLTSRQETEMEYLLFVLLGYKVICHALEYITHEFNPAPKPKEK